MKRFLAIMLAILMMLTVFASCNKGDAVPNETDEAADGETTLDESTADVTDAPADGTDKPADGTDAPAGETDKPADGTDKPADGTDKPADGTDKPADGTDTPSSGDTGNTTTTGTAPVLNGKTITFGSFPQKKVTDDTLIAAIKSKGNTIEKDGTLYRTVDHEGKKYFGILANTEDTGTWFEFAPLTWTVLTQNNGQYLVLCDSIIDIMAYGDTDNKYGNSQIRTWLNGEFLKLAFADNQYAYIVDTTVDNGASSTGYSNPEYYGENTTDKVFLLSRVEVKDASYGLDSNSSRIKYVTDYANWKINGAYDATNGAWWWLRTPSIMGADKAHGIRAIDHATDSSRVAGGVDSYGVTTTTGGVVPAMWIKLQ